MMRTTENYDDSFITNIDYQTIDLLDRDIFVDQIIKIVELSSNNRNSIRFAINGSWGVGKSFVLDMIEKKLEEIQSEDTCSNKYLVFHYNCWEYDYYEEPLVAIVASMLDTINEKENLISNEMKSKIKGLLKAIGSALLSKGNKVIKEKTGIEFNKIFDIFKETDANAAEAIGKDNEYDSYFNFKTILKNLQKALKLIAEDKTIIFVVDELDRCLPEYSIKVLERLHHVFEKTSNIQVILSTDKTQLENTIKTIFGQNIEPEKYFSKFINFEVKLDEGVFNDLVDQKFDYYLQMFDYQYPNTQSYQVDEFKTRIFDGIDIRSRYEIINKCNLIHKLLVNNNEKEDFSLMCIELLLAVLKQIKFDFKNAHFNISSPFDSERANIKEGLNYLNCVYTNAEIIGIKYYAQEQIGNKTVERINAKDIYGIILVSFRHMLGYNDKVEYGEYTDKVFIKRTNEFWKLLQVIS